MDAINMITKSAIKAFEGNRANDFCWGDIITEGYITCQINLDETPLEILKDVIDNVITIGKDKLLFRLLRYDDKCNAVYQQEELDPTVIEAKTYLGFIDDETIISLRFFGPNNIPRPEENSIDPYHYHLQIFTTEILIEIGTIADNPTITICDDGYEVIEFVNKLISK